jgi:ADP-ribosylglycohydrolase
MQQNYTHITIILDRTGSMDSIRDDTIGGYNSYLEEQQAQPDKATLTLVQFDSQDPYEVIHHFLPVQDVPKLTRETYKPRASTPLLDALGRGINDLEQSLAALSPDERPNQLVVVVVTDGEENASREFTKQQVAQMIREKQEKLDWQFVFLSADLDAIRDAEAVGIRQSQMMAYDKSAQGTRDGWSGLSKSTSNFRAQRMKDMSFAEEDRDLQQSEKIRKQMALSKAAGSQSSPHSGAQPADPADPRLDSRTLLDALFARNLMHLDPGPIFTQSPKPLPAAFDYGRVEGMLLGLAIGDSLGNTTEAQLPNLRRQKHGEIRNYLPNHHAAGQPVGVPSDDTQMAFWLLEQLLEDGRLQPNHLAQKFSRRTIFGIGGSVKEFIRNYKDSGKPWYESGVASAGNGALMRIAPVLLPYVQRPSPELYVDAALAAMVTHNDRGSTAACVAFVAMLWELLGMARPPAPEWWVQRYVEIARPLEGNRTRFEVRDGCKHSPYVSYRGPLWRFVEEHVLAAWTQKKPLLVACNEWCSGAFLLETLPTVLYTLMWHAQNPEEAIVRAVNDSYDNDTVAAIVGAAVGALHGVDALPQRWRHNLLGRTTGTDDGRIYDLIRAAKARWR